MLENWPYNRGHVPQVKQNVLIIEKPKTLAPFRTTNQ